jgi:sterol desaturase/sphingolipid hydroxylase (fatty acid hydroxylase superfamily)
MLIITLHALIIATFLGLGALAPRQPLALRDTWLNLLTGGSLALVRVVVASVLIRLGLASPTAQEVHGLWRLPVDLGLAWLVSDLARYGLHRLHHTIPALWQFHQVHHSSERLDASSGLRMHVVDFVQLSLLPVVLFRVVIDGSAFHPWTWPLLVLLTDLVDAYQHANLDAAAIPAWLSRLHPYINNPIAHSWHHSSDPRAYNHNYGQALLIWDRLLGTSLLLPQAAPELGLPPHDALEPSWLGLQLLRKRSPSPP